MPIYEFVCQDCGNEFERIQSWSDTTTPACTSCNGTHVLRNVSRPAVHFKGSGWYITDSKNGAKNGAGESKSSETKDESKSETKAEAKTNGAESTKTASGDSKKESSPAPAAAD